MTPAEKETLHHCGLFHSLSTEDTNALLHCLHPREEHFQKNDILWNIGDSVLSCVVILSGAVRAEILNAAGEHSLMAFHTAGALVGDVLMATPGGRSPVLVTAAEDVTLLYLDFHRIMGGCAENCPRHIMLRENLVSEIASKFWAQRRRTACLASPSLRRRIALRLRDEIQRTGSLTLTLGGTREDLADYLGVNRSALSRELSRMKADGILDTYRDSFRILDPERLAEIAG